MNPYRYNKCELRCFCCGLDASLQKQGPTIKEVNQAFRWDAGVIDVQNNGTGMCFAAVCCWPCFWDIDPDMWIRPEYWQEKDPVVSFDNLPSLDHDNPKCWEPTEYKFPVSEPNASIRALKRGVGFEY